MKNSKLILHPSGYKESVVIEVHADGVVLALSEAGKYISMNPKYAREIAEQILQAANQFSN